MKKRSWLTVTSVIVVSTVVATLISCSSENVGRWRVHEPPVIDSDKWRDASGADNPWIVYSKDSHVYVYVMRREPPVIGDPIPFKVRHSDTAGGLSGTIHSMQVSDGFLIGWNAGEFGGGLWWFSPDGGSSYKISDDQICEFVDWNNGLYALEGLAHLWSSWGTLIEIVKGETGKWESHLAYDFQDEPAVAQISLSGDLFVVTFAKLLRVSPTLDVTVLVDSAFWRGLYPSSVIVPNDTTVYIGMRGGVARVIQGSDSVRIDWLNP